MTQVGKVMTDTHQITTSARTFNREWSKRAPWALSVLALVAAAVGLPVIVPGPDSGSSPVMAIARADCPPDCGGGPGNGGTPSGPAGGGTEFVPPSMPAMPSYEPGCGYPAPDQNNGISIYNSAAPQPSQAAQPSRQPVQNQDGSYNRAANGEQQPINYTNAPNNQGVSQDWQQLSDQLNSPQNQQGPDKNQSPNQDEQQSGRSQSNQQEQEQQQCRSIMSSAVGEHDASALAQASSPDLSEQEDSSEQSPSVEVKALDGQIAISRSISERQQHASDVRLNQALTTPIEQKIKGATTQGICLEQSQTGSLNEGKVPAAAEVRFADSERVRNSDFDDCLRPINGASGSSRLTRLKTFVPADGGVTGDIELQLGLWPGRIVYNLMTRTPNGLKFSGKDNSTPGVAANGKLMVIVIKAEPISKTARSLPLLPSRAEGSVDDWAAFAVCPEVGPVDRDIRNRLALIDSGNFPNAVGAGTRGGDPFNNHSVQLPTRTSGGTPITYQEWDVRDKLPNQNRNQERIVIGSDGSAYYTGDHYDTFVRIR